MARKAKRQRVSLGALPPVPGKRPVVVREHPLVLIVEDEAALRVLLSAFFESEGYAVVTASDGLEGLEALKRSQPDVMIVDMMMPRMDGPSFIAASAVCTAAGGAAAPVVMLSAAPGLSEAAVRLGVDYLSKPFDLDELLNKVTRHSRPRPAVTAG